MAGWVVNARRWWPIGLAVVSVFVLTLSALALAGAQLGNAAEWVGAGGTVAAFGVTLALLYRELENRRADTDERIRRQARQVSCWLDYNGPAGDVVIVRNSSDEPVYQVAVVQDPGYVGPPPEAWWDVVPPGDQVCKSWCPNTDVESEPRPVLSFTDAAGIWWVRDTAGRLQRDPEEP